MTDKNRILLNRIWERAQQAPLSNREWGLLIDVCEIDTSIEHVKTLKQITKHAAEVISRPNTNSNPFAAPPAATITEAQLQAWRDNYWRAMRALARVDFDAFLIYVERYRPPDKKFYGPRRRILHPLVQILNDIEMELNHDYSNNPIVKDFNMSGDKGPRELILNMPARVGKLLSDETPMLTTRGWTTHGELKVGDYVFSPEGQPIRISYIRPKHHTTHTLTLSDGTSFDCHFRHEWKVYDRWAQKEKLLETQVIATCLTQKNGRPRYYIPLREPLQLPQADLPVAPYSLGAWLGDGTTTKPRITGSPKDKPIVDKIVNDGYIIRSVNASIGDAVHTNFYGLREDLRKLGLCQDTPVPKFIPTEYLMASKEQRLELLAGLLDTDGTLCKKDRRYSFSTTNPSLRDGVADLVRSLGWRATIVEYAPKLSSSGIHGKLPVFRVDFNPTYMIPCQLERKQLNTFSKQRRLAIVSIEEAEQKPGHCITVDGGMYLAGKELVPTHNTGVMTFFAAWIMGRDSDRTNIYSAFSAEVTTGFYEKVDAILTDTSLYAYDEIFPGAPLVEKHADRTTIDVGHKMHYPSLTCRTIDGSLNGVCDASGYIFADDLVKGTEEARSPGRLSSKQKKVNNDLLKRESGNNLKIVWMGTNWSPHDPMASRKRLLKSDPAFKDYNWVHVAMPGVDPDTGESNFDYDYGVGFTTEQYARDKAKFLADDDLAGWETQVMCNPTEYFGMLFPDTSLTTYNGTLPPSEHERTIMFVDPAFGGGDYTAGPVCQIVRDPQGVEIRAIPAVICSKEAKERTIPEIVRLIKQYKVAHLYVEANKMTRPFAEEIQAELKRQHVTCAVTTQPAPNNKSKEHRIWDTSHEIKQLWFLDKAQRNAAYNTFMGQVNSFNPEGDNTNDDAPDSLAGLISVITSPHMPSVTTGRLWG